MATQTPWGTSQDSKAYGRGIISYSTAGHGGFHVCPTLNRAMPDHLRLADGWYEEDCEWARVAVAFPDRFEYSVRQHADRTLKNWAPDAWEAQYHETIPAGESYVKDERARLSNGKGA